LPPSGGETLYGEVIRQRVEALSTKRGEKVEEYPALRDKKPNAGVGMTPGEKKETGGL